MNRNNTTNRRSHVGQFVLRACLIVSLWQAPVPWIHSHGTEPVTVARVSATQDLVHHLALFHPAVNAEAAKELGWHLHWILPCWGHALDDTPDDESPATEVMTFDQATVSSAVPVPAPDVVASYCPLTLAQIHVAGLWPRLCHERFGEFSQQGSCCVLRC
ncbi:hypothetical protein [Schlesneria paludicola]|uniref:hypothetical protein n=1 Tax=Schlesneria paludicola TaxID=360056 RepID=UPI000299D76B|nr:hypothetical protein [Schlesneria paludicola]